MVTVTRYGARHWAVWLDGELVVVALYKKGAAIDHASHQDDRWIVSSRLSRISPV